MMRLETAGRWTIWCSARITRRKYYNLVTDPSGEVRFSGRMLWQCVEYLDAEGVEEYEMRPSEPERDDAVHILHVTKGI